MIETFKNCLEKIQFNNSYFPFLESCNDFKVKYFKDSSIFKIDISLDEPIPTNVYFSLIDGFKKYLSKEKKVEIGLFIHLNKESEDMKIIKDYIISYLTLKENNKEILQLVKKQVLSIHDNCINIKFTSVFIEEILNEMKPKLEKFLSAAGFSYLKIKYIYIEPESINNFDFEKDREQYQQLVEEWHRMSKEDEKAKEAYEKEQSSKKSFFSRPSFKNKNLDRKSVV